MRVTRWRLEKSIGGKILYDYGNIDGIEFSVLIDKVSLLFARRCASFFQHQRHNSKYLQPIEDKRIASSAFHQRSRSHYPQNLALESIPIGYISPGRFRKLTIVTSWQRSVNVTLSSHFLWLNNETRLLHPLFNSVVFCRKENP